LNTSGPVVAVRDIGKRYDLGETLSFDLLQERVGHRIKRLFGRADGARVPGRARDFWALKDVSFDVKPGEVLGLVGRNGAGKSTLLKILSRITEPTEGEARIRGRIASLLEVGTGFHKELTGRENVFLNGAILGMTRAEIRAKFSEIVEFAGVETFIDTPVKRYSSGMTVRLAFAVAAHLDPEILLVDEVLAVGDAEFQRRCLAKMDDVAATGRTILFVSHNLVALEALCSRVILLEHGRVVADGETRQVLARYQAEMDDIDAGYADLRSHQGRPAGIEPIMVDARLADESGKSSNSFRIHDDVVLEVAFARASRPFAPVLGFVVRDHLKTPVFGLDNKVATQPSLEPVAEGRVRCRIPRLPLMPGRYSFDLYLGDQHASLDRVHDAVGFNVVAADVYGTGKLPPPHAGSLVWTADWTLL
jgi:lipopolysaccharide transport system ATP-binding protein